MVILLLLRTIYTVAMEVFINCQGSCILANFSALSCLSFFILFERNRFKLILQHWWLTDYWIARNPDESCMYFLSNKVNVQLPYFFIIASYVWSFAFLFYYRWSTSFYLRKALWYFEKHYIVTAGQKAHFSGAPFYIVSLSATDVGFAFSTIDNRLG